MSHRGIKALKANQEKNRRRRERAGEKKPLYLVFLSDDPHLKAVCPNRQEHTKCPTGYLDWHDWAEKKSKTHKQIRCPGCKLFAIWVKKERRAQS